MEELATLVGHRKSVTSLDVSADSKWLLSASMDRTLRIWDVASNQELALLKGQLDERSLPYSVIALFSPPGDKVISHGTDDDWALAVWDWRNMRELGRVQCPGFIRCMSRSRDGRYVAVGGWNGPAPKKRICLAVYNLETGTIERQFETDDGGYISGIAFSQDGHTIIAGDNRGNLRWFAVGGDRQTRFLSAHKGSIEAILFIGENAFITAGAEGRIACWSLADGHSHWGYDTQEPIASAAFCPARAFVAVGGHGSIRIWRLEDVNHSRGTGDN